MIDRRFLNIRQHVSGFITSLPDNPAAGQQFIVSPNSESLGYCINFIVRFNGAAWEFIPPRQDMLEVINSDNGDILAFDGSNWNVVVRAGVVVVDDIMDFDFSDEQDKVKFFNIPGVKFISTNSYSDYDDYHFYVSYGYQDSVLRSPLENSYSVALNEDGKIYSFGKVGYGSNVWTAETGWVGEDGGRKKVFLPPSFELCIKVVVGFRGSYEFCTLCSHRRICKNGVVRYDAVY